VQPSPELFFQTINAYQQTAALKAGIELDVFTAIGEGANTALELARRCQVAERGARILCDYLVSLGFLGKTGDRYKLSEDSAAFLDRRSPACLVSTVKFLGSPMLTDGFKDLAATVRKGGTLLGEQGTLEPNHPIWVEFARSMAPLMALPAQLIARLVGAESGEKWKVLDVAAGHGLFGIAIAQLDPNAEIVAHDWRNVLEVAKENARAAGVADRYRTLPGGVFRTEFGSGYNLVLLTNFLHHFDLPTCETILRKVHAALAPDGRAVTLEFVPNDDRVTPRLAAQFSLMMLGTTPAGDAYTFAEFERMFRNAGFTRSELHPLPPTIENVIISDK
jgi:2-polyprenyl-3-methyl-5-hydroxy-6-metoxy-1,4-benzoquinol methylase